MDRLTQDLLTYTRIGRTPIDLKPVSVSRLVREIIFQYPKLSKENADIEIIEPLLDVIGHEPSVTQVVSNLLTNAVKFVRPGIRPHVKVSTVRHGDNLRIWVEDNGIGLRPEHQARMFKMFERVHSQGEYEGTGVGLAIVRKAVGRMNGSVGVESDGTAGSRFWVELPIAVS